MSMNERGDCVPRQLRRRRAASRRLPPLVDGRRDTLDQPRARIVITRQDINGTQTVRFAGEGARWIIRDAADMVGARYHRDHRQRDAWLVHADSADDLEAVLSLRFIVQGVL